MTPDSELLQRYAHHRDQAAFRAWVERRLDLVYSVALRVLNGDVHLAQDVAQQVFTDAARHATTLARHPKPTGWLFTSTRYAAAKLVRTHQRRRLRESIATMDLTPNEPPVNWEAVRPVLDEALAALPATDRDAILQRYFEQADYAAIAARLAIQPNAARMRVERALERLTTQLRRRGITSTAAALGTALTTQAITAAPAGLAASISTAALATGSLTTAAALLAMLKAPLIATVVVVATGVTLISRETSQQASLRSETLRASSAARPRSAAAAVPSPTAAPSRAPSVSPTVSDSDYAALEHEVTTLQSRLAELDRAAVSRLRQPALQGKIYNVQELDAAPKPSKQVKPKYPTEMRLNGITGQAVISMTIDQTGAVRDLQTVSTTEEVFAEAALAAVSQWQFEPGQRAGLPVNTRLQVPILFNISNEPADLDDWF